MIIAYINENISLSQIDEILPNHEFEGMHIERTYVMQKFKRNENGKILFPSFEEDAEEQLINNACIGDIVVTSSLINFSNSLSGVLRTIRLLNEKEVRVVALLEDFDSSSEQGKAFIYSIPLLQKYNRNCNNERITRQRKGIKKAKAEGKFTTQGRKPITSDKLEHYEEYLSSFQNGELSKTEFARRLGISRPTLDKLINKNLGKEEP